VVKRMLTLLHVSGTRPNTRACYSLSRGQGSDDFIRQLPLSGNPLRRQRIWQLSVWRVSRTGR
jgi:hypothetical protein